MVFSIVLLTSITVIAETEYTIEKVDHFFFRSDGAVYETSTYYSTPNFLGIYNQSNNKTRPISYDDLIKEFRSRNTTVEGSRNKNYPKIKIHIPFNYYQDEDGNIYADVYYESAYGNRKYDLKFVTTTETIKEAKEEWFLDEDNTLYLAERESVASVVEVAKNVKDFKVDYAYSYYYHECIYRTEDNKLYTVKEGQKPEFLLDDASEFYFVNRFGYFIKSNDGKWYHKGWNKDYVLEPQKIVDGKDVTGNVLDVCIEATEYILKGASSAFYEHPSELVYIWDINGDLYYEDQITKERTLLYEDIIYYGDGFAINSIGDTIFLEKTGETKYIETNIKKPETYLNFRRGEFYPNTENGISCIDKEGKIFCQLGKKYPDRSDWAEPEIKAADNIGYIDSVKFIPMQNRISREEFCNVIVDLCEKYLGKELPMSYNPFKDVDNEKVVKAYEAGIVSGVSFDEFSPDTPITREQMCVIMTRAAKFLKPNVSFGQPIAFRDMNKVSSWAVEGVNAMSGLGIVKGDGVSIVPNSNTTIEQAIVMTYRLYNEIK